VVEGNQCLSLFYLLSNVGKFENSEAIFPVERGEETGRGGAWVRP
jgi:hypothetical protein